MNNPVFQAVSSIQALAAALEAVRRGAGAPGGDGESVAAFLQDRAARLTRLSDELRQGLYRPGPLRRLPIPKKLGGTRMLAIPCVTDRVVQRAAKDALEPILEPGFEESSHGYRVGRGVQTAVARVAALRRQGYTHVVDGDIRSFFDSIPHDLLVQKLAALVPEPPLLGLVGQWLAGFSGAGRGLAQGSPLSPLLANLFLDALDEAFGPGPVRIVRFADDFLLLCRTQGDARAALDAAERLLMAHGLEMNRDKTRIVPFEGALRFLGHLFVRSVMVRSEEEDPPRPLAMVAAQALSTTVADPQPPLAVPGVAGPQKVVLVARPTPARPPPAAQPPPLPDALPEMLDEDLDGSDLATGRAPLYVLAPGRRLEVRGEAFAVLEEDRVLLAVPAHQVHRIELGAQVEAADTALRLAAAHGLSVTFLDGRLQPAGVLMPPMGPDAGLHLAQARQALDPAAALGMARRLVAGRVTNARVLLIRLNRRRGRPAVRTATAAMARLADRARLAVADVDAARGVEGAAARLYWPALGALLQHGFTLTRRRDDPASPVVAILNWTAALLQREVRAAVLRAGLHPGFGTLHAAGDGREACVYDLMEEFRAPLAEGLTAYLFNNRILQSDDFVLEACGVRVVAPAGTRVIRTWESWLGRPIQAPGTGRRTSWRGLVLLQARALARAVQAGAPYHPYAMDH